MSLKHLKVSALPDGPDPTQVQASDWNDDHDLSGLTWSDFPAAMRPTLGSVILTASSTTNAATYATKGTVWHADSDLDVLDIRVLHGAFATTYRAGVALCTPTISGGVVTALSVSTPLAESADVTVAAVSLDRVFSLSSPVHISAGSYFLLYSTVTAGGSTGASINRSNLTTGDMIFDALATPVGGSPQFALTPFTGAASAGAIVTGFSLHYPRVRQG